MHPTTLETEAVGPLSLRPACLASSKPARSTFGFWVKKEKKINKKEKKMENIHLHKNLFKSIIVLL